MYCLHSLAEDMAHVGEKWKIDKKKCETEVFFPRFEVSVVAVCAVVCEVVLSFAFSESAEVDGMSWAVVVACHTGEAVACVEPFGVWCLAGVSVSHPHVANGTVSDACAASVASCGVNLEPFVVDEPGMEDGAETPAVEPRCGSAVYGHTYGTTVGEYVGETHECRAGFHLLLCLAQVGIDIHEGEADIGFGHEERAAGVGGEAYVCKGALKLLGILATAVACREEEIGVGAQEVFSAGDSGVSRCGDEAELVEEAADEGLKTPSVDGEAEADALAVVEPVCGVGGEGVGNGDEALVGGGGKCLRCPICVAGAGEIENHRDGVWVAMRQNRMEQWLSCVIMESGAMRQNRMEQWLSA